MMRGWWHSNIGLAHRFERNIFSVDSGIDEYNPVEGSEIFQQIERQLVRALDNNAGYLENREFLRCPDPGAIICSQCVAEPDHQGSDHRHTSSSN